MAGTATFTQLDGDAKKQATGLVVLAEAILDEPTETLGTGSSYAWRVSSRKILERSTRLAFAYRYSKNKRFLERLWTELEPLTKLDDWHPADFAVTAELTHATAIGYDWCFEAWTEEQRKQLSEAIRAKGLAAASACYQGKHPCSKWVKQASGLNLLCNAGIGLGAMAIEPEAPVLADETLREVAKSLDEGVKGFAPDGGWPEGLRSWSEGTRALTALLASLEQHGRADMADLAKAPGLADTGLFAVYLTGPTGQVFNYGDVDAERGSAPQAMWLGRHFDNDVLSWYAANAPAPGALGVLSYAAGRSPKEVGLPLDRVFQPAQVVSMRSAWGDPNALFVALHAADNRTAGAHLDAGTFVLEAGGQRFAIDLGEDEPSMDGYFDSEASPETPLTFGTRWLFYRARAEGHNTLVLNPSLEPDQYPSAEARIEKMTSNGEARWATADLTPVYLRHAKRARRGVRMLDGPRVLLVDEVTAHRPSEVLWFMHTRAKIDVQDGGRRAVLRQGGTTLTAWLASPADGRFEVMAALPLPNEERAAQFTKLRTPTLDPLVAKRRMSAVFDKENPNQELRKLAVRLLQQTEVRIAVVFEPEPAATDGGKPASHKVPTAAELQLDTW